MTLRVIFAAIAICFAMYALITNKYQVMPYMLFFLGLMGVVIGVSELKVDRRTSAIISFLASAFALFVSFYTFNTFN
ncbi:YczI family protein [Bacillus sp. FJAT-22090]|uniref:YczI family protein n=1 Tax=Bacillus sp. FJAT-22090 TaxID=1581038 RepID=UPI001E3DCAA1|nr:YczI family protein [Bacillus sp. FJAT-22090]